MLKKKEREEDAATACELQGVLSTVRCSEGGREAVMPIRLLLKQEPSAVQARSATQTDHRLDCVSAYAEDAARRDRHHRQEVHNPRRQDE